jgi:hypothetical protein
MQLRAFSSLFAGIGLLFTFASTDSAFALRAKDGQVILDELNDYDMCQSRDYSGEWCQDALVRWVQMNPNDAFKAGKMTRRKMNAWGAIPFFAQAFDMKKGDCKDEDVKLAVMSALDLPASYDKVIKQAKTIGLEICINEFKDQIAKEASPGGYMFKNSCKELMAKGALQGLKKKKCEEETKS